MTHKILVTAHETCTKIFILNFIIYSYLVWFSILNSWLVYEGPNYTAGGNIYTRPTSYCRSTGLHGSVRNLGHPTDISISTISLLGSTVLCGNITQYTTDVPDYNGAFSSFVITSPGEATFYTQPNYGGFSICLKPNIREGVHWTLNINDLGIEPGDIRSMKFGCDSTNIVYSSTITNFGQPKTINSLIPQ